MFQTIDDQRRFVSRVLLWALWALAPIVAIAATLTHGPALALGGATAGIALGVGVVRRLTGDGAVARVAASVALMASISMLVAALAKHPWQIDMHMAYFAGLAVLIGYCDWRATTAATAVVAAHHLLLSFLLPAAVFPGGGNIERVLIHAVILLVEAGVLIWAGASITSMFERSARLLADASEARERAEGATADAERARAGEAEAATAREALQRAADLEAQQVVGALARALARLAAGDLSYRVTADVPSQYLELKRDYNAAAEQLGATVRTIIDVNGGVRGSIGEIARAAGEMSRRTESQAAMLEETAAALDEITGAVRRTAGDATRAREVVGAARTHATQSGEVVKAAIDAMTAIEASSNQISQIIGVIDEIAFQTNLLALNAGVEAARAGEAGRGFAVVAAEVRALAQRSAEAAKQIKGLISGSAAQVDEGVELVGRTGEALDRIVAQVADITGVIAAIATSADEQATGLKEINTAVNGLDGVTQQNAAMVEEATAATHSLSGDAERLTRLVAGFQVKDEATAPSRAAA